MIVSSSYAIQVESNALLLRIERGWGYVDRCDFALRYKQEVCRHFVEPWSAIVDLSEVEPDNFDSSDDDLWRALVSWSVLRGMQAYVFVVKTEQRCLWRQRMQGLTQQDLPCKGAMVYCIRSARQWLAHHGRAQSRWQGVS